jgi:hypothetical protein
LGARDLSRAWESVLMAQNDTPSILVWIMRLTAFPPPPPTPRTCYLFVSLSMNKCMNNREGYEQTVSDIL